MWQSCGAAINAMDRGILLWLQAQQNPTLTLLMLAVSYAGEGALCWWALSLALLARRHPLARRMLGTLAVSLVIGVLFTNLPQLVWYRPRPYTYIPGVHQLGYRWDNSSFPSGHTVSSFNAAIILGHAGARLRLALLAFAALMGLSRLYLGMHHPSDVLFGAVSGVLCGYLSWHLTGALLIWWRRRAAGGVEVVVQGAD